MTPRIRFIVALTIAIAVGSATYAAQAGTGMDECRFQRLDAGTWTQRESKRTISCFAGKMGVSSATALAISYRESRWHARAYNPTGCGGSGCLGLFQHHAGYWGARKAAASDALSRYEVRKRKWQNPRTMAVVTFVMVRHYGWGAW